MPEKKYSLEKVYFYDSAWLPIYTAFCILGSFPIVLITTFIFRVSVESDIVFGILVAFGGPLGDIVFRKTFKKAMYFIFNIPAMVTWPLIGFLVMLFRPLE